MRPLFRPIMVQSVKAKLKVKRVAKAMLLSMLKYSTKLQLLDIKMPCLGVTELPSKQHQCQECLELPVKLNRIQERLELSVKLNRCKERLERLERLELPAQIQATIGCQAGHQTQLKVILHGFNIQIL